MKLLLRAGFKKQKQSMVSITVLFVVMTLSIVSAMSLNFNSRSYIQQEMNRLGFGNYTIWVSNVEAMTSLEEEISSSVEVDRVSSQKLIYAGYSVGEKQSDDEGQLLLYEPERYDYKFFNMSETGLEQRKEIKAGEIYVSPAMASIFNVHIGDDIEFRLSRDAKSKNFRVAGYFEDPFMGSSMIDMKSFLIGEADFSQTIELLEDSSNINVLARSGAMIHVFQKENSKLPANELGGLIESTLKTQGKVEFSYSESSIYGFMLILQNIMTGFLLTFAVILLLICGLILGHSISNNIEQDYKNIGILKTIGCTSKNLRFQQIIQYLAGALTGIIVGIILAFILLKCIVQQMVYSIGMLIPSKISLIGSLLLLITFILILISFIFFKTRKIMSIAPIPAMQGNMRYGIGKAKNNMKSRVLLMSLAIRQIQMNKKRYLGIAVVAFLLSLLVTIIGQMNVWLGPNGEGLMNSFSVAEHDLGVQPNHSMNMGEVEEVIQSYANIVATYELAMQKVTVNQADYTVNVLDQPKWFQLLKGRVCTDSDEMLVTEYVAADLGVDIGEKVQVKTSLRTAEYTIVGIYTCANQMGANVGMSKEGYARIANINDFIWCKHYILSNSTHNEEIMKQLQSRFPMDMDVHTNSWSGLDSIVQTMKILTVIMYGIVILIILVVVRFTSSKFLQAEQSDMAILKSQGMTVNNLRVSFALRFGATTLAGVIAASLVSMFFTTSLLGMLLRKFGISNFHPTLVFWEIFGMPVVILLLFMGMAYLYSQTIKSLDIIQLIRE